MKIKLPILLTILFFVILVCTRVEIINILDIQLSLGIYNFFNNSFITQLFVFITDYGIGTYIGWVAVLLVLLFLKKPYSKFIGFTIVTAIIVEILKVLIQRARPFIALDAKYLADIAPSNFSFPSGHTTLAFFVATYLCVNFKLNRLATVILYSLAILVGVSRVYLGAHYVLDVVAGGIIGILIGVTAKSLKYSN